MIFSDFIIETLRGRTIYRILFDWQVKKHCHNLTGEVVDLAGGNSPSYYRYLPIGLKIVKTNMAGENLDIMVDFNKRLPFNDASVENYLLFNALYIAEDRRSLLHEIKRTLKPGGRLFLSMPFIANEMPEPHDYVRLTAEGLERELQKAGFQNICIERFGDRFSSAVYLLHPFFMAGVARLPFNLLALLLDELIPGSIKKKYPTPLGYFATCKAI